MSEDRLVIETRKSLYDPIEFEIDGKVYQSKKATRAVLSELNKLDEQKPLENDDVLYKAIQALFEVDTKTLDKLDKREVQDIYVFMKKKFFEIEKQRADLLMKTFGNLWQKEGQPKVKEIPPKNRKRPGSKA